MPERADMWTPLQDFPNALIAFASSADTPQSLDRYRHAYCKTLIGS